MIIAYLIGFIVFLVGIIRKRGFKRSSVRACVAFTILTTIIIATMTISVALNQATV